LVATCRSPIPRLRKRSPGLEGILIPSWGNSRKGNPLVRPNRDYPIKPTPTGVTILVPVSLAIEMECMAEEVGFDIFQAFNILCWRNNTMMLFQMLIPAAMK